MAFLLEGLVEGHRGQHPLPAGIVRVGRSQGSDLRVDDPSVSREHAELTVTDEEVRVSDLGSKNGTWVEGERISQPTRLLPGVRIRFGRLDFVLRTDSMQMPVFQTMAGISSTLDEDPDSIRVGSGRTIANLSIATRIDPAQFRAIADAAQLAVRPQEIHDAIERLMDSVALAVPARRIFLLRNEAEGAPSLVSARPAAKGESDKPVLSRTILETALRERTALLLSDPSTDERFKNQQSIAHLGIHSAMVAPLFEDEELLGLLYADTDDLRHAYDLHDLTLFTLLANLTAATLTHARLQEAQRERERMRQEFLIASQVQQSLLSVELPQVTGYALLARQIPCYEVGGDLYDITPLKDGRIAVAVGDVTGKGLGAALLMANVIASLRVLYEHFDEPAGLMEQLHRNLLRSSGGRRFVTLFLGILDPARHEMVYVNAGHCPPLLFRADGEPQPLEVTGMPAGLFDGATYESRRIDLPESILLCCVSDGITEAGIGDVLFEDEALAKSVRSRLREPLDGIADGMLQDLRQFTSEQPLADDVTLFLLRREA